MPIVVAIGAFLMIWAIQTINRAVSGDPRGSFVGEGVFAVGFGVVLVAATAVAIGSLLILASPLVFLAIVIVAVAICALRGR